MPECEWCHTEQLVPCSPRAWRAKDKCPRWKVAEADFYRRIGGGPVTMFPSPTRGVPPASEKKK